MASLFAGEEARTQTEGAATEQYCAPVEAATAEVSPIARLMHLVVASGLLQCQMTAISLYSICASVSAVL